MNPVYFPLIVGSMGFLGALFGGIIGIVIKARIDASAERNRWAREDRFRHVGEQLTAYKQFFAAMDRHIALNREGNMSTMDPSWPDPLDSPEKIDKVQENLRELGEAHEAIKLIAPPAVVEAANKYVSKTFLLPPPDGTLSYEGQAARMRQYNETAHQLQAELRRVIRREIGTDI